MKPSCFLLLPKINPFSDGNISSLPSSHSALTPGTLGACGKNESAKPTSSTNNHQSKGQGQVTLILKTEKESKKKSVEFKKGDTVLDVLKEIYPVQENDGFITEIDGISQDKEKGIYWMFDVNGKIGEKAANQLKVQDGDEIKFYQEKYN